MHQDDAPVHVALGVLPLQYLQKEQRAGCQQRHHAQPGRTEADHRDDHGDENGDHGPFPPAHGAEAADLFIETLHRRLEVEALGWEAEPQHDRADEHAHDGDGDGARREGRESDRVRGQTGVDPPARVELEREAGTGAGQEGEVRPCDGSPGHAKQQSTGRPGAGTEVEGSDDLQDDGQQDGRNRMRDHHAAQEETHGLDTDTEDVLAGGDATDAVKRDACREPRLEHGAAGRRR